LARGPVLGFVRANQGRQLATGGSLILKRGMTRNSQPRVNLGS
jgi:hypothetical protein